MSRLIISEKVFKNIRRFLQVSYIMTCNQLSYLQHYIRTVASIITTVSAAPCSCQCPKTLQNALHKICFGSCSFPTFFPAIGDRFCSIQCRNRTSDRALGALENLHRFLQVYCISSYSFRDILPFLAPYKSCRIFCRNSCIFFAGFSAGLFHTGLRKI